MNFEDVSTLLEIANRSAQKIDLMIHGNVYNLLFSTTPS